LSETSFYVLEACGSSFFSFTSRFENEIPESFLLRVSFRTEKSDATISKSDKRSIASRIGYKS